jgi:hypothetical protein
VLAQKDFKFGLVIVVSAAGQVLNADGEVVEEGLEDDLEQPIFLG